MTSKHTPSPRRSNPSRQSKKTRRVAGPRHGKSDSEAFDTMSERLDMMLPEVMARIAAVEHVLVEKGVCSHQELRGARQFIDEQEGW